MRILIIVPRLLWEGGGDRQVLMLASYLQKEGQKVVIYTAQYAPQQCYPEIGQALDIRVVGTQGNGEDVLKMSRAICDDLKARNEEYDVINCHIHPTQWVSSVMKKQLKIPVVWMSNDMPSWFLEFVRVQDVGVIKYLLNKTIYAAVDRFFVKSVDRIVVLSERERLNIRKYYNRDATVIRSGLKEDYFNKGN
jgi:hypothetical protein